MATILLTNPPTSRRLKYGAEAVAGLQSLGDLRLHEGEETLETGALIDAARGCDIIVADRLTAGPAALFAALPQLRAFVRCAMDVRNIDVAAASRHGVLVTHAGPGYIDSVVELIVGQMVDLCRGMSAYVATYRAGRVPEQRMGRQLAGRTAGILGYGHIGRRLAEVLKCLGMRVVVSDPNVSDTAAGIERVDQATLVSGADFVICFVLHSPETEKLMNASVFRAMKPDAFFVNASRGGLVDEDDLHEALTSGAIAGAALDVGREPDDIPPVRLASLPNVVATPHIAGQTPEAIAYQALETVEQVRTILAGSAPKGALNAEHWTRARAG